MWISSDPNRKQILRRNIASSTRQETTTTHNFGVGGELQARKDETGMGSTCSVVGGVRGEMRQHFEIELRTLPNPTGMSQQTRSSLGHVGPVLILASLSLERQRNLTTADILERSAVLPMPLSPMTRATGTARLSRGEVRYPISCLN